MTKSGTIGYALHFAAPVTGLSARRPHPRRHAPRAASSAAPVGSGADYTISITGCTTGSVGLYLNADTVTDAALKLGPAGPIGTARVTIDSSLPEGDHAHRQAAHRARRSRAPRPPSACSSPSAGPGRDTGSGIASYDVARSYDGGRVRDDRQRDHRDLAQLDDDARPHVQASGSAPGTRRATSARGSRHPRGIPGLTQNSSTSLAYTGSWATSSNASNSGGSVKRASAAGSERQLHVQRPRDLPRHDARARRRPGQVWVDGVLASTVDTYAAATTYRQVVFGKSWSSYASHTIKLVVVGTARSADVQPGCARGRALTAPDRTRILRYHPASDFRMAVPGHLDD